MRSKVLRFTAVVSLILASAIPAHATGGIPAWLAVALVSFSFLVALAGAAAINTVKQLLRKRIVANPVPLSRGSFFGRTVLEGLALLVGNRLAWDGYDHWIQPTFWRLSFVDDHRGAIIFALWALFHVIVNFVPNLSLLRDREGSQRDSLSQGRLGWAILFGLLYPTLAAFFPGMLP